MIIVNAWFADFRRRSRPQSLTLSTPDFVARERRNSAPHLVHAVVRLPGVANSLQQQQQTQQQQQQRHSLLSTKAQTQPIFGSLGDLSPQTLIKTKAIRKINGAENGDVVGNADGRTYRRMDGHME